MALQEIIVKKLPSKNLLQTFSWEFMKQHMGDRGFVLGVFVGKRLVAFRNVYFPDPEDKEWNLGIDLGLGLNELSYVANLQMVCVHPDFRGNALALSMNKVALQLLRELKSYYHICATVSPDNIWNIPVLLASGFSISKIKAKYGGKIRYIAYQDLRRPLSYCTSYSRAVRIDDLEMQKKLMDIGYHGTHIVQRNQGRGHQGSRSIDIVFQAVAGTPRDSETIERPYSWEALPRTNSAEGQGTI